MQIVDIRAKERLTGAAILVAFIVLVVPELLSGPNRRAAQRVAVTEEAPMRSVTVELGGASAARSQPGDLPATSRLETPPVSQASPPAEPAESSPGLPASPPAPLVGEAHSAQDAHSGPSSRPAQSAVPAAPQLLDVPHLQPADSAGWWVQVGSFESRKHADAFMHRLRVNGFAAVVLASARHGRKWYRVRVGPEQDRAAAQALAVRLHAAGQVGSVVSR